MSVVEIKNLTKYYKKSRGIEDVSFSIDEGEIFGFIGPNGAGKSTTIRTLLNFIYPTSGSATIFGKDIVKQTKEIRKNVGYLPSEIHYYDDMKAVDLLTYSANFHGSIDTARLKELSKKLDLDVQRKIEDLSFGNRKKVGIIQALLHKPKLLILDEPTSGLDPLMQQTFFELLDDERKRGVTIFFSSHILSEVQKMCDRVGIIKDGKLIKIESVKALTENKIKTITLTHPQPEGLYLQLEGIVNQEVMGEHLKFLFSGDIQMLLRELQNHEFVDILIEEPSLEEVFMHYYER